MKSLKRFALAAALFAATMLTVGPGMVEARFFFKNRQEEQQIRKVNPYDANECFFSFGYAYVGGEKTEDEWFLFVKPNKEGDMYIQIPCENASKKEDVWKNGDVVQLIVSDEQEFSNDTLRKNHGIELTDRDGLVEIDWLSE